MELWKGWGTHFIAKERMYTRHPPGGDESSPCRCFSSVLLGMLARGRISGLPLTARPPPKAALSGFGMMA